ncbi:MAG TPA: STAS domain-containing protein [Candidatus Baltobacteraceae bacterium]|nr:STAS domain-containing protein [Candidatus Baltobacteraceae bacterium]
MTRGPLARFTHGEIGGHPLLEVSGEIDLSNAASFATALEELRHAPIVVIDMSALRFMDSSAINALARLRRSLRPSGSEIYLVVPLPVLRKILSVTGLDRHFHVVESRQDLPPALGR